MGIFITGPVVKNHNSPKMARELIARNQTLCHSLSLEYQRRNPSCSAQGEGDDVVQHARSAEERGRGRGNAGRRARGKGPETSNRQNAESEEGRDGSGRRSENRAGEVNGEAVARPAVCTAEVMNASESWPEPALLRRGCWPMRKETDSCPVAVLRRSRGRHRFPYAREASCCRALPCWGRQLRRRAQRRAPHLLCSTEGKPNATALTAPASKRHKGKWSGKYLWHGEGFLRETRMIA